ncbi:MAG: C25 family cysteine peptidase [Candidatus Thorarchaeota archaeon]
MIAGSPFFAVSSLLPNVGSNDMQSADSQNDEWLDSETTTDSQATDPFDFDKDVFADEDNPHKYDPNPFFDQFKSYSSEIQTFTTDYIQSSGAGYKVTYRMEDMHLFITATIGSYDIVSYTFDEGTYDSVQIGGTEVSASYGAPALPYKNLILSLPDGANVLDTQVFRKDSKDIYELDVLPGPEPLTVSSIAPSEISLWFDPLQYSTDDFLPSEIIHSTEVGIAGQPALYLTLYPLQYNPTLDQGNLALQMEIQVTFDRVVSLSEVVTPPESQFGYEVGGNYVIVVDSAFVSAVTDFVDWKTSIGWDVSVRTVQDIYALYSGRDNAEDLRDFIVDEYSTNGTLYYLLVGDGDIVAAREVWDPMDAGMGLDNGTEASDLYFECLDGDWDSNGNDLFGEMDDTVDLFPEVSVGRLPVQTPDQAEHTLAQIISIESNPEPGSWIDDFMLIAPDCFGPGDGVNMVEEVLNQKHLIGSFFDVDTFYPTDGSLSNAQVVSRINAGVGLIDFFDHGAYDVWVGALTVAEALGLTNGDKAAFAFGMACETAAFDAESVEPTIGEAFFRAPSGGYHTYIAATRIAWAGYHCFDGFHHRFWDLFFADIFDDRVANPKSSMMAALYEMATVFDVNVGTTRETIYHAIYFGDPTIHMSWKQDVTTDTTAVGINEEVTVDGTCLQFQSGIPLTGSVNITVKDPIGRDVFSGAETLNGLGEYSVSFFTNELSGNYTVETTVGLPFVYTAETEFYVGDSPITLSLDSTPTYHANVSFSGTSPYDGTGTARVTTLDGVTLESISVTASSGVFSGELNITRFGWLNLYVMIDSGSEQSGLTLRFKVSHGDILIISDSTGGYGPDYPGGWPSSNYGDSTNFGDIREALEDEYEITEWRLLFNGTPTISYLHQFDAVLVSMGDAYAEPLTCMDSFIIDILQQYHDEGGNLLFEGGSFLSVLSSSYSSYFSTLFHVSYTTGVTNTGSLYLDSGGHPITSGLPSTIFLEDGLGSENVDVFSPIGDSLHVSGYSGGYSGGTAISALPAKPTHGAVVTIGFAIDAIQSEELRYKLVQNAVGFLLHPTLTVILSDDAIPYGTSETVWLTALEASTGTPVAGAEVSLTGCGVIATNMTKADGTCSVFVNPSSFGEITVEVSKAGFLNYSTSIIIYDKPIISVLTDPLYAEKGVTQTLTVFASEFYEDTPLEGCAVNLTGCGVSVAGTTNSSGLLDLTIHPTIGGRMILNVTLSGYVNSTTYVGIPINVAVLRSYGTMYPEDFAWEELNTNWNAYGDVPVIIDYTSLGINPFTLTDIENTDADVLVIPYSPGSYSIDEVNAIISYVEQGNGLVASSTALFYSPDGLAPFLGVTESLTYSEEYVPEMHILNASHPVMQDVTDPYYPAQYISFYPLGIGWEESVLDGAEFLAIDSSGSNYGAILTYRGMVYFSNYAPWFPDTTDYQIFYNALTWSDYITPEHDLAARLETPTRAEPSDTIYVNATVRNQGIYDESDVVLRLFIDDVEVENLTIPTLVNGTTQTLTYAWTPIIEKIYNVTAFVDYVADEYSYGNNDAVTMVNIRPIIGWILWDESHDNDPMIAHSSYIADLEYEGFVVEAHTIGPITSAILSSYNVLVCAEFYDYYTLSELTDIQNFVMNGGGLLVMGDNSVDLRNDLTSYAGIEWIYGDYYGPTSDITAHPVTDGVTSVYFGGAVNVLSVSGSAISLVRGGGSDLIAASEYGSGFIVAICDDHFLDDGDYENLDNPTLAINIMDWISIGVFEHDVTAALDVPSWTRPNQEVEVLASVVNRGLNDEVDVTLNLYIEDILVDSLFVPFIQNRTSETLTYYWTPVIEAIHNVTVTVSEVPDENVTRNNVVTRLVNVNDLHDYYMIEGSTSWYDAVANGVNLGISGDDTYGYTDFAFTFPFYDSSFDRVYISTNGWLSFANTQPYDLSGPIFPSSQPGFAYCVVPYLADLQAENNIYAWSTPDFLVIQYNDYNWLGGPPLGTFQVVFHSSGIIEINYLEMFDTYWGIGGLNHGNGIHGNAYPVTSLGGVSNFGVTYYYEQPDHEITLSLHVPSTVNLGSSPTITTTISNMGSNTEIDLHYTLYIDGFIVDEEIISELLVSQSYPIHYLWNTPSEGIYNITAYVEPVFGEAIITNNVGTTHTSVEPGRSFSIIEPTSGATIDGGLVYVAFEWSDSNTPSTITLYVNSAMITQIYYLSGNDHLFAPIFQNGTNVIELEVRWSDSEITTTSVSIQSENVVPQVNPIIGDEANYRIEQSGMMMDYNFTFTGLYSPFVWEVAFEMVQLDPATGAIITSITYPILVNILNGYIVDGDVMGWTGMHLFWMTGIDAPMPMQSFADIGDHGLFFGWSDVFTIVDSSTWNEHPSWLLELSQSMYNYVAEALMPNGLLVDLEDVSMGLHLYLTYSDFVPEPDTTPPEWVVEPSNYIAECGVDFEYQLQASDNYNIISWSVNDTTHFEIDDDGVLGNSVFLPVGSYPVEVTVTDTYLNSINASFVVEVVDTRAPTWITAPSNVTLEHGQGLSMQLVASDPSGIASWSIDDTTNFAVDSTGLVTNITSLAVGTYNLTVTVADPYGNSVSVSFTVTVEADATVSDPYDIMIIVIMIGGIVGIIVIIILIRGPLSRRRGG